MGKSLFFIKGERRNLKDLEENEILEVLRPDAKERKILNKMGNLKNSFMKQSQ